MALSNESITGAARRKAQRARPKVEAAEADLHAANEALREALPARDVEAIAQAAERTATAEDEVREAAHELEGVDELLAPAATALAGPRSNASGEGVASLLRRVRARR